MAPQDNGQAFACACGKLTGRVAPTGPGKGARVICYCTDCRAVAVHLRADSALLPDGGVAIYQTRPDYVTFDNGVENLACLRLSPTGLLRWYASCCNTPLANSLPTRRVPFASMFQAVFADPDALGPVTARINTASARPGSGAPLKDSGFARAIVAFMQRAAGVYISRRSKVTPFFNADGQPVVTPHVISPEDRSRAST